MTTNKSIGCKVTGCAYHAETENYCTLDQILVNYEEGHQNTHNHSKACTDCDSFKAK